MSDEKKPFPESLNTPPPGLVLHKTSKVKFDGIKQGEMSNDTPLEALEKSISNSIQAVRRGAEITRIAFEEDPKNRRSVGVWKRKSNWQIPDHVIKRIAMSDDLVAAIVQARSMFLSPFGKELKDRFSIGYRIEPNRGVTQDWSPEKKEELQERIKKVSAIIGTCGYTEGFDHDERLGLDSFLYQQVANGIKYGRFATEIIWVTQPNGEQTFQAFRPVDAATIYAAMPREDSQGEAIRNRALYLLEQVTGRELTPEREAERDYAWYQVVNDQAIQAFTHNEMFVHQFYPTTDVELMGYPMTPLDACIAAVTTHMNITTHNKLYFQNGRAARGMVVFQSDDVDQAVIDAVRQHFQATANSVSASFRVPVIAVGANDKVMWQPIEAQGGRDMEFQYLSDSNARSILTSFMMSPEELPGMAHLSRGSNSQTLSESSNEYQLIAARDTGLRPLIGHFQTFINEKILPLLDPTLAKICTLKFYGLDSDSAEKESTRLQEDMPLHGTYDEMLERVEKDPIGREWGGEFPFNASYQQILFQHFTVGEIKAHFFGRPEALKDPALAYIRDPMWFQWQQLQMQAQQVQAQQQQMQAQAQQQAQPGQEAQGQPTDPQAQGQEQQQEQEQPAEDSAGGDAQQMEQELSKAESQLEPAQRRVLQQHKRTVKNVMASWKKEARSALNKIVAETKKV